MKYYAEDYIDRLTLDHAMGDREKEENDVIIGTYQELQRLNLSPRTVVNGVPCQIEE